MKKIISIFIILFCYSQAIAQETFITSGKIEFEKRVNLHKQLDLETDNSWRDMMKKTVPPIKVSFFNLFFDKGKTLYKPGKEVVSAQKVPEWIDGPANDNIVFSDLDAQTFNSQKTVFESVFNINDSLRKIEWKIWPDTRTIANFECRKATAIIMDSVFVVAFYTDQIVPSGGPESFNGLPGMILGLAIPRMNTTWFATKLELVTVGPNDLAPPKKGKKTNEASLRTQLKQSMKDRGKWGDKNIWQIMI